MPRYTFTCPTHGRFDLVRKFEESGDPAQCPDCGVVAKRVYYPVWDVWNTGGSHRREYGTSGYPADKPAEVKKAGRK